MQETKPQGGRVIVCGLDEIPHIVADAMRTYDPEDPRGSGSRGSMPGLRDVRPRDLPRLLYHNVGLYRRIVDAPADDIWDKGWDIVTDAAPEVAEKLEKLDKKAGIKQALKRATRYARRDGWAVVRLKLRDNSGDPSLEPSGVREVIKAQAVPRSLVDHIDRDEAGEAVAYWFHRKAANGMALPPVQYHKDRVLFVVQHQSETDEYDGEGVLDCLLGDAQGHENVKWAAAESYFRYGSPLYVVHIEKDFEFDPAVDGTALEEKLKKIRNNVTQKAYFKGMRIEALANSNRINPPDAYHNMFLESIAGGSGIPKRELTGSEAGALASASWDEKRYFGRIQNDQADFATPLLMEWYGRLDRWELVPDAVARIRFLQFLPHLELGEKEAADVLNVVADAAVKLASVGLPFPEEVSRIVTWPEGVDVSQPLRMASVAQPGAPPAGGLDARTRRRHDLRIEVSAKLRELEDDFQVALLGAYREWRAIAEDSVYEARRRFALRGDEPQVGDFEFPSDKLHAVFERFLFSSADLGMARAWADLHKGGVVRSFLETEQARTLSEFAFKWSTKKAADETSRLRDIIAEAISDPDKASVGFIRKRIRENFGRLESEVTIARTESMRGFNHGSLAAMKEAGIGEWEFQNFDAACPICIPLDGLRFPVNDTRLLPPDGTHPNCRCRPLAVVPGVEN